MDARVLFTFVGNHDPMTIPAPGGDPGPVLSLLGTRRFEHVVLFITRGEYSERARVIQQAVPSPTPKFSFVDIELQSVVDYEEIYRVLSASITRVTPTLPYTTVENFVLLDPGTPQMQTVWFLMVQSGAFDATLLQGIPAQFADGQYRSRIVRIDPSRFPVQMQLRDYNTGPKALFQSGTEQVEPPRAAHPRPASAAEWTIVASDIIGRSPQMKSLMHEMGRAARYEEVVCITGETGTGKELVARHIHTRSPRASNAFIPLNAASLTSELLESNLFGHAKGAFTGAASERMGSFRSADGGTLFLDEVGELPLTAQSKLLRAIDQGEITPVGHDRPLHVDVRLIVATHRDLPAMVAEGTFREDLYERLRQLPIHVPALRERDGDTALLAETFLRDWVTEHDEERSFTPDALELLVKYHWPRNVRQLKNVVRQLCVFTDTAMIDGAAVHGAIASDSTPREVGGPHEARGQGEPRGPHGPSPQVSPAAVSWNTEEPIDLRHVLETTERAYYQEALRRAEGNRAEAARLLGLRPPAFRKALRDRFPEL